MPAEHALVSLLALNGLRVSEATGAGIEHLGLVPAVGIIDDHLRHLRPFPRRWPLASLDHWEEVRRALRQL